MKQKDIANLLGVSQTAVSLVWNNPDTGKVSEEKKRRILSYLRENSYLNYSMEKRTWNVGYIVDGTQDIHNEFYHHSFAGIERQAERYGFSVFLETCTGDELRLLKRGKVDGLIVRSGAAFEKLEKLAGQLPMVLLNCASPLLRCDTVMPDNVGAMYDAVACLLSLGHRRIAFLGASPRISRFSCNYRERTQGFEEACNYFHTELEGGEYIRKVMRQIVPDQGTRQQIGVILKSWLALKKRPTAAVCVNHFYAVMLMH